MRHCHMIKSGPDEWDCIDFIIDNELVTPIAISLDGWIGFNRLHQAFHQESGELERFACLFYVQRDELAW
jgi:hypothetical protein